MNSHWMDYHAASELRINNNVQNRLMPMPGEAIPWTNLLRHGQMNLNPHGLAVDAP